MYLIDLKKPPEKHRKVRPNRNFIVVQTVNDVLLPNKFAQENFRKKSRKFRVQLLKSENFWIPSTRISDAGEDVGEGPRFHFFLKCKINKITARNLAK